MTNTLSKCLVNDILAADKLLTNYKKVFVNKTFMLDSFGKIKIKSLNGPCPFKSFYLTGAGRWGWITFISETSDLWIRGQKQQMK